MKYTTVTNLQWNLDNSLITCAVDFVGVGELPFSASPNDTYEHGREIYARCIAGEFGPIADYVPQPDEGPQEIPPLPPEMQIPSTTPGAIL